MLTIEQAARAVAGTPKAKKPKKAAKKRKPKRTKEQWIASRDWNIKDATEALQNAVTMQNWAGVHKYATQLEKLKRERHLAESEGPKRTRRDSAYSVGARAGDFFGRGFGREYRPGWK